jgi:hypothetical protein
MTSTPGRSHKLILYLGVPTTGRQTANVALVGPHVDDVWISFDAFEKLISVAVQDFGLKITLIEQHILDSYSGKQLAYTATDV